MPPLPPPIVLPCLPGSRGCLLDRVKRNTQFMLYASSKSWLPEVLHCTCTIELGHTHWLQWRACHRTGDTAEVDENGSWRILGRTSTDIIKSGGYKISALQVSSFRTRLNPHITILKTYTAKFGAVRREEALRKLPSSMHLNVMHPPGRVRRLTRAASITSHGGCMEVAMG